MRLPPATYEEQVRVVSEDYERSSRAAQILARYDPSGVMTAMADFGVKVSQLDTGNLDELGAAIQAFAGINTNATSAFKSVLTGINALSVPKIKALLELIRALQP